MSATILLVEDEPNDVLFFKMAMENAGVKNPIQVAQDGQEALDYFQGEGKFADRQEFPIPYLVMLDLKLPHLMGLDVLKWLREQEQFRSTVVVILTSSRHNQDIIDAYKFGTNAYLVKPSGIKELNFLARTIKEFWLTANQPAPIYEEQVATI